MNQTFQIAVDSGKSSTKVVMKVDGSIKKLQFRTKVTAVKDLGIEMSPGTNLVAFNQKSYIVGDMISEDKTDFELSKQTMAHKIAIYLAIAKILRFCNYLSCYPGG